MSQKKYISLNRLSNFLENLRDTFASLIHKHTIEDITDYVVDLELSATSTNSVQNKVLDAEFNAISNAMGALELAIDGKADASHTHDDIYYTETEVDNALAQKSQVQMITPDALKVLSTLKIHKISQEQYDQELKNGTLDADAIYLTPDEDIDLSQYVTIEHLNTKADVQHIHEIVDVNNLQATLDENLELAKEYADTVVNGKANSSHTHDDRYYTETEIDNIIANHKHDSLYDASGSANLALEAAKSYTDSAVSQKTQVQIITWEADD